ncbi:F-box/LRR-repeat protein At3g58900-like isoform X2 [Hevea brasiliensis]|uniref:F-box/LRR-repeat protein At3g58900-like isoform X2 n=1 Tax=Hevea brasiliensis TaxID=3981 RepID=UPI0025CD8939|nr:F-box/LRR-repeat protein At3g58900-like isoform X2 [Hevea brasiliensis]
MKKCYRKHNDLDADCSCCHLKEQLKETDAEDRISQLPSDVLVLFLSHLPMKDAAQTSILSRRWRYLWAFFSGTLDFDASLILEELRFPLGSGDRNSLLEERLRFVRWVNQVLGLHKALTVDGLRIIFDVGNEGDVDNWIKFALDKKVQKLELDFTDLRMADYSGLYSLPSHLFHNSSPSSLTALHLKRVNVTGGILEYLLSHCPFLEVLSVKNSSSLLSLNIRGPTLKLTHLELWCCRNFKKLEISAVNLVSLSYRGPEVVHFKYVPQLLELSVAGNFFKIVVDNVFEHSSFLSRLKTLNLHFPGPLKLFMTAPQQFPELSNLKYLELKVALLDFGDLFLLTPLTRASPSLHKLTLLASMIKTCFFNSLFIFGSLHVRVFFNETSLFTKENDIVFSFP